MSVAPDNKPSRFARYAFWAWLAVLVLLLLWLGITLSQGPSAPKQAAAPFEPQAAPVAEPGFIVPDLPAWGSKAVPAMPFDAGQEYLLTGFALQGFYQTSASAPVWGLSLPRQTLEAQLLRRGPDGPGLVGDGVRLFWELEATSAPVVIPGAAASDAAAPTRRGEMALSADGSSFTTVLPLAPREHDGTLNPYPLVKLTAVDAKSGAVLAQSAAVMGVSPGFSCAHCHTGGGLAILEVHDRHQGTALQERARKGDMVDCRSCHGGLDAPDGSAAPGVNGLPAVPGLSEGAAVLAGVSASVHGWHAQYMAGRGADACLSCHIGLAAADEEGAGPRHLFMRDLHKERGLDCTRCHGPLEEHALALLKAEAEEGRTEKARAMAETAMARLTPKVLADKSAIEGRRPWAQEPDCAGCHDFARKPDLFTSSAFNKWTANEAELFSRRSDDMGVVRCVACHGAPHALYPADNPLGRDRDNIAPLQYQQHARPLGAAGNCAACHGENKDYSAHHPLVQRSDTAVHVPEGVLLTQPQARFSHQSHESVPCQTCHHTGREDGRSLLCTSSGCHDSPVAVTAEGQDAGPRFFRTAFHGPQPGCFACHEARQRTGEPAGPLACKDCHLAPSPRWAAAGGDAPVAAAREAGPDEQGFAGAGADDATRTDGSARETSPIP